MVFTREFIFEEMKVDHSNEINEKGSGLYSVPLKGLDEFAAKSLQLSSPLAAKGTVDVNKKLVTQISFSNGNSDPIAVDIEEAIEQQLIFLSLVTFDEEFFDFTRSVADPEDTEDGDDEEEDNERDENEDDDDV